MSVIGGGGRTGLAVTLALAIAATAVAGCGDSGDAAEAPPIVAVPTDRPADAFAPLVRFHEGEETFPIDAERFIQRASLKWRDGVCLGLHDVATGRIADRKTAAPVPRLRAARLGGQGEPPYRMRQLDHACERRVGRVYSTTELTRPYDPGRRAPGLPIDRGFYLDLLTDSFDGDPSFAERDGRRELAGVPAYYEVTPMTVDGFRGLRIDYWMLFGHTVAHGTREERPVSHEGDWQRVAVLMRLVGERSWRPVRLEMVEQPSGRTRSVRWRDVERSGNHPVVYSALESHAMHAKPGEYERRVPMEGDTVTVRDDATSCDDCVSWRTWGSLHDVDEEPWYGFGGGWGFAYKATDTSGPRGPGATSR
jgi:hypothetical protein